jgi:hypothetical protein
VTADDAIRRAAALRETLGVPAAFAPFSAELAILRIVEGHDPASSTPPAPGPVRDVRAWVVRLRDETAIVEIALEDGSAALVRFRR